jgi:cell division protein FtsB
LSANRSFRKQHGWFWMLQLMAFHSGYSSWLHFKSIYYPKHLIHFIQKYETTQQFWKWKYQKMFIVLLSIMQNFQFCSRYLNYEKWRGDVLQMYCKKISSKTQKWVSLCY